MTQQAVSPEALLTRIERLQADVRELKRSYGPATFDCVWRSMMAAIPAQVADRWLLASVAAYMAVHNPPAAWIARRLHIRKERVLELQRWLRSNLLVFSDDYAALQYIDGAM